MNYKRMVRQWITYSEKSSEFENVELYWTDMPPLSKIFDQRSTFICLFKFAS